MTDREVMQQALDALEDDRYVTKYTHIVDAIAALREALEQPEYEPVAWAHKGPLGFSFSEKQNEAYSIPLYCAPMTMDTDFIQIPVAYQYAYSDGNWRCSYGDPINGCKIIASRALYARKDGK